jgi:predicted PurR-regulated permease PerM
MNDTPNTLDQTAFTNKALEAVIRIGVVVLLAAWCFQIVRPFIIPVVWGIILAIAAYPSYRRIAALVGGRPKLAATLFIVIALVLLIIPTVLLSDTLIGGVRQVSTQLSDGTIDIPPPPESVRTWPLIGKPLANFWSLASANLTEALSEIRPQIKALGRWLLATAAGVGFSVLQFVLAIFIAGVLLAQSTRGGHAASAVATRLAGKRGEEFANLAEATVRSVARGILGVALIQSFLAGLGFLAVGIPGAGFWALLCLLLSVVQIGPGLVLVPCVIYVFSTGETLTAVLFLAWSVFVALLDNILKPMLLGRGVNVPMVVIFIGAIGGFLSMGIIGLFVGSIILVLGYTLLQTWLSEVKEPVGDEANTPQETEG